MQWKRKLIIQVTEKEEKRGRVPAHPYDILEMMVNLACMSGRTATAVLHPHAKVSGPQINSRKSANLRTSRFADIEQMWHFAELRFADSIFFVICGLECGFAICKTQAFCPKLKTATSPHILYIRIHTRS